MVTFEYVGYFNGAEMVQVLNGIAAIVGSENGFGGLVKAIAIGGFITVMMTALIKLDIKEAAHYVLALAFVNTLMFAPLGRVVVIDKYAATTTASATVVDNVPLGVAFAVGELNHIGVYMTDLYESVFSEVDAPKFTTTGMMFGARLYEKLGTLEISDVNLRRNMGSFVTSCVNPELVDYPDKVEPLRKSGKLVEDLLQNGMGILNPARIVSQTYSQIPLDCVTAGQGLAANFAPAATDNVSNTILDKIGASLNLVSPRDVGAGNAALRSIVAQKMETGASYIMSQSLTAKDQIDQAVMANLFTSAQQNAGALSGDTATAISSVLAKRQVEQQYKTMRVIAEEALPRLRSMVEYVCVAIFPAVLLIMVAAGAKALLVLRVYLGILLSINLWPPLYAVVNHLMTLSSTKYKMAAIVQNEGVLSLNNIQAIQAAADSDLAMAGLLTLSIPAIALALVKGGDAALTGAIGGITAPATSAAGSVAANTSSGNFNYGNYGAGGITAANTQVGQSRRDPNVAGGFATIRSGFNSASQGFGGNPGGNGFTSDQSAYDNKAALGATFGLQQGASQELSLAKSRAANQSASASNATSQALTKAITSSGTVTTSNGQTGSLASNANTGIAGQVQKTLEGGIQAVKTALKSSGISEAAAIKAAASIGGETLGGFNTNLAADQSVSRSQLQAYQNSLAESKAYKDAVALTSSGGTGLTVSSTSSSGTTTARVGGVSLGNTLSSLANQVRAEGYEQSLNSGSAEKAVNSQTTGQNGYNNYLRSLGAAAGASPENALNVGAQIAASQTPEQNVAGARQFAADNARGILSAIETGSGQVTQAGERLGAITPPSATSGPSAQAAGITPSGEGQLKRAEADGNSAATVTAIPTGRLTVSSLDGSGTVSGAQVTAAANQSQSSADTRTAAGAANLQAQNATATAENKGKAVGEGGPLAPLPNSEAAQTAAAVGLNPTVFVANTALGSAGKIAEAVSPLGKIGKVGKALKGVGKGGGGGQGGNANPTNNNASNSRAKPP